MLLGSIKYPAQPEDCGATTSGIQPHLSIDTVDLVIKNTIYAQSPLCPAPHPPQHAKTLTTGLQLPQCKS